jgi:diguanylate cyclase
VRQSDIIREISGIIIDASVEASPENYDICHRYITRSDSAVCVDFETALAKSNPLTAQAFGEIRDKAGPARGQIDAARFMRKVDEQLTAVVGAASDALGHTVDYGRSLDAGAADLKALDLDPRAEVIIANLAAQTTAAAERAARLEAGLIQASDELSALRQELEKAKRESSSDALTSLPNRRAFDSHLLDAICVAEAARQPLSLAFCDVDHFKNFNDTWGHSLGDQVLRFVGSQLASQFNDIGLPARFGGEEFVVLLPKLGLAEAFTAVSRFCDIIRARVLRVRSDGREIGYITLSAGITTLRRGEDASAFIERADAAMYAAKKAGRNRVVSAT